jgi:hypothetical protein
MQIVEYGRTDKSFSFGVTCLKVFRDSHRDSAKENTTDLISTRGDNHAEMLTVEV